MRNHLSPKIGQIAHYHSVLIKRSLMMPSLAPRFPSNRLHRLLQTAILAAACSTVPAYAFDSGSTGADGALSPTANIEIPLPASGILNYTSVNIPANVTVTFKKNEANTPVYLLISGDATIAGTIDIRGKDGASVGEHGDGLRDDDGWPGEGGPGGFSGGYGGNPKRGDIPVEKTLGGNGLGPGGGLGGIIGNNSCSNSPRVYSGHGTGGAYAQDAYAIGIVTYCDEQYRIPAAQGYGSRTLQPLMGGSGGGGGLGGTLSGINYAHGSGGGGGGGAILIAVSGLLNMTGSILADGGHAGGIKGSSGDGAHGGGGSGGAIRLAATQITGKGTLSATGGCVIHPANTLQVTYAPYRCGWTGGSENSGGSPGRVRIEAEQMNFSGKTTPTASTDIPGSVFSSTVPQLRIASVAGQNTPLNPVGIADLSLPATTTGPVVVTFETVNVPLGSKVQFSVRPVYGEKISAESTPITGTLNAGSAQATVTLPQGSSTLEAMVTYTIDIVAGHPDLSQLAQNETVNKVHIAVALAGDSTAELETASGKRFSVPYTTLRAMGFQG